MIRITIASLCVSLVGCSGARAPAFHRAGPTSIAIVGELHETPRTPRAELDSVSVWSSGDEALLIATAKKGHGLRVYDPTTGELVRTIGSEGRQLGEFLRPNGLVVVDDLLLVCERDNQRVQVLRLPEFVALGSLGEQWLQRPYGLTAFRSPQTPTYDLYVTDNFETANDHLPRAENLDKRVKHFRFSVTDDGDISHTFVRSFGDLDGEGGLLVVESIYADPLNDRLLIADEDPQHNDIKVYDLSGRFTGQVLGKGIFAFQAEGIALKTCRTGGYWLAADQGKRRSRFHVFDRRDLRLRGSFSGSFTSNTDGVVATDGPLPGLPSGAVFAVHDDRSITTFDWRSIAAALELSDDC